jgi:hypothetical protein
MASHLSEPHTSRVSRRKRLRARTYLHDHIHQTCLALALSCETCSEDDEMPSKEEAAIMFTIHRIDVLLQNGLIPLSLHLSQPDIDIDLLLARPLLECRFGDDNEAWAGDTEVVLKVGEKGDRLESFAEALEKAG